MKATNIYTVTVPMMVKSLRTLSGVLEKAEALARAMRTERSDFESALLNDRLIFNQFPLLRQVQIATDNAKNSVKRLTGKDVPTFEDTETTFAELQERIKRTIEILEAADPDDYENAEAIRVALPYWGGKSLSGFEYVTQYLIPNFYFHVSMAYAIVRKNGVQIGKSDYIGELPLKE